MSTNSQIGIKYNDNCYKTIYCHFDGYPSGVGHTLLTRYNNLEAVEALIELGAISSLENTLKATTKSSYFVRDGEKISIGIFSNIKDYWRHSKENFAEYAYLFDVAADAWFIQKSQTENHLLTQEYIRESEAK